MKEIKPDEITEEMLIGIGQTIVKYSDKASILLGELAIQQQGLKVHSHLKDFSKEIGKGYKTISSYMSIEKRLEGLDLPEDINYSARRTIAQTADPKDTLKHVLDDGLSSAMIITLFGNKEPKEPNKCPKCGTEVT